jgi:2-(3-amino-3-carboxypropyl)histidine synthase
VVALQFPEGLLVYSCLISDILCKFANVECIIMGDVTYGACCVDDYTAKCLVSCLTQPLVTLMLLCVFQGADFLIHYGHSCLINIAESSIGVQYVFVDISFDTQHLVETVRHNFSSQQRLAIVGTIQYASSFHRARQTLLETHPHIFIPQANPLTGGELLGCTAPTLPTDTAAIIYVADGR